MGTFLMLSLRCKCRGGCQRRKGIHHFVRDDNIDIVHDGGHAVDFQKTDVASQFTAPSKSSSHYDSTTPVIDDKVAIDFFSVICQLRCLCV